MDVLSLLRSKNRCLLRFLEASKDFLSEAETTGMLPSVSDFETQRESILKAISLFDRKIADAVPLISQSDRTSELSRAVESALNQRDETVTQILILDDQVLRLLENEKQKVSKELAVSHKNKNIVQKFKSGWINESGEEIDQNL